MRHIIFLTAFFLLTGLVPAIAAPPVFCSPPNGGASCLTPANNLCNQLGMTTLDGDQKNLVACLKNETGTLVWKAMTDTGTPPVPKHMGTIPLAGVTPGVVNEPSTVNLGNDWDIVQLEGSFAGNDNGPAGGTISRKKMEAVLSSATGGIKAFSLTNAYQCVNQGIADAELCVRVVGGDLQIKTGNLVKLSYVIY